jgi:thioredoxin 1
VRGVDVRSILSSWNAAGAAPPPPPDDGGSPAAWAAWAERVDRILLQLDSVLHPSRCILGGSAVREAGAERLIKLLTVGERIPGGVTAARLGLLGGVKGAAWGAAREFRTRDALSQVRKAIGNRAKTSPQALSPAQLRAVFDQFALAAADADGAPAGVLSRAALADMLRALAVDVASEADLRRVFTALDADGTGGITWGEWSEWWSANVASEAVQLLLSSAEFEAVLADAPAGQLVCLEVGMVRAHTSTHSHFCFIIDAYLHTHPFIPLARLSATQTFCRPCKAFEKTYKAVAAEYPAVKFLRLNGNENRSCTALARDTLGLRSTPAFYFFRPSAAGKEPIASHTGANEPRLREALERLTAPGAADADVASAAAAAASPAPPAPPPPKLDASKIDTSGAEKSGLAALLSKLSIKQACVAFCLLVRCVAADIVCSSSHPRASTGLHREAQGAAAAGGGGRGGAADRAGDADGHQEDDAALRSHQFFVARVGRSPSVCVRQCACKKSEKLL